MTNEEKRFRDIVKLMVLMQCTLEQMDEIRNIKHLYRHDIKKSINVLEKKLEQFLRPMLGAVNDYEESIFMQTQRGVEHIINSTIEEIHNVNLGEDGKKEEDSLQ